MAFGYRVYSAKLEDYKEGGNYIPKAITIERWKQRQATQATTAAIKSLYEKKNLRRAKTLILRTFLGMNEYIRIILKNLKTWVTIGDQTSQS